MLICRDDGIPEGLCKLQQILSTVSFSTRLAPGSCHYVRISVMCYPSLLPQERRSCRPEHKEKGVVWSAPISKIANKPGSLFVLQHILARQDTHRLDLKSASSPSLTLNSFKRTPEFQGSSFHTHLDARMAATVVTKPVAGERPAQLPVYCHITQAFSQNHTSISHG